MGAVTPGIHTARASVLDKSRPRSVRSTNRERILSRLRISNEEEQRKNSQEEPDAGNKGKEKEVQEEKTHEAEETTKTSEKGEPRNAKEKHAAEERSDSAGLEQVDLEDEQTRLAEEGKPTGGGKPTEDADEEIEGRSQNPSNDTEDGTVVDASTATGPLSDLPSGGDNPPGDLNPGASTPVPSMDTGDKGKAETKTSVGDDVRSHLEDEQQSAINATDGNSDTADSVSAMETEEGKADGENDGTDPEDRSEDITIPFDNPQVDVPEPDAVQSNSIPILDIGECEAEGNNGETEGGQTESPEPPGTGSTQITASHNISFGFSNDDEFEEPGGLVKQPAPEEVVFPGLNTTPSPAVFQGPPTESNVGESSVGSAEKHEELPGPPSLSETSLPLPDETDSSQVAAQKPPAGRTGGGPLVVRSSGYRNQPKPPSSMTNNVPAAYGAPMPQRQLPQYQPYSHGTVYPPPQEQPFQQHVARGPPYSQPMAHEPTHQPPIPQYQPYPHGTTYPRPQGQTYPAPMPQGQTYHQGTTYYQPGWTAEYYHIPPLTAGGPDSRGTSVLRFEWKIVEGLA
ncbi:hypothetical protein GE09DRAFT_1220851 [Coniochaeta sp. 2T2.1]|nr:hypothetical protein GE09DRAFT_1220851 [Coniochaeta sp. 2T2.1]